jgi:hypothetical protein
MKALCLILVLLVGFITGCGHPTDQKNKESSTVSLEKKETNVAQAPAEVSSNPSFSPFFIFSDKGSRDNHYTPSGFMPNGNCITFDDTWGESCQSGRTCIKVKYDVACSRKDQKWAGIYWLNPPDNWGKKKGGFNLTGAEKLTFWAKGDQGGEQIQEFTVGGITGDFPDTDTAVIGPVILTNEWKEYTIDLRGKDLSYISGGFAWTTSEDVNAESCVFYMDNIKFE